MKIDINKQKKCVLAVAIFVTCTIPTFGQNSVNVPDSVTGVFGDKTSLQEYLGSSAVVHGKDLEKYLSLK